MSDDTKQPAAMLSYTVPQALARVPIGRSAFYAALKSNQIPNIRVGGKILIPKATFDRMFGGEVAA
jgi:excisionase family DNA binding protein